MTREFTDAETVTWMQGLEKRASSAAAALYDARGRVLVVKAHYKRYWSFPGGVVDAGETPRAAAVREVQEETGVLVDQNSLVFKLAVDRVSPIAQTYQFVFDSQLPSECFDDITLDSREIEDWALVTREQITTGDRYYSQTTVLWANGYTGYSEQQFGPGKQADI